jgi:uroporphyrinogen decarboxylase
MAEHEQWTSWKRVYAALNHQEPDRVPINFGGCAQTTILECPPDGMNCTKLYQHLGITNYEPPITGALANQVYNLDERVMRRFGSDFRLILPNGSKILTDQDGSKTILGISCGLRVKKMGYYDDVFEFPLQSCTSITDIKNYPYWPSDEDIKTLAVGKREEARQIREKTGCVIIEDAYLAYPALLYAMLSGYDKWLMDMKLDPQFYFSLSDKLFEIGLKVVEYFIGEIGDLIDIIGTYDDLGTQEGPILSHSDYEKFLKPYEVRMIEQIRKYTDAKIYRHSCGSVYDFIPDFIEMGVDILNPVQPLAKKMEPWRLKKEFGKDLTFMGGFDIQELLPRGSIEDIRRGAKELIETYAPGGGYIFATSHNIEPDTPVENVIAMFDAVLEYGRYPIKKSD